MATPGRSALLQAGRGGATTRLGAEIAESDFAWTVGSLCQINRILFDPALLLQRFPAPRSFRQRIEILRAFGFRTGEGKLAKAAYPCVDFVADNAPKLALFVKRDAERLLCFLAGSQTPQTGRGACPCLISS